MIAVIIGSNDCNDHSYSHYRECSNYRKPINLFQLATYIRNCIAKC